MNQDMTLRFPNPNASIIKVIGVGGGGGNAVAHMFEKGISGVDFAVCNTDIQALEENPIPTKIQLGPSLTEGRGAGNKPEMGKQSCIESIDEVRQFLDSSTKMLFITAGMGGGTGTGAAPIIAKAAKELDILTVAIVTIPFKFEGMKRRRQALEGLELLKVNVDSILVISNDRLRTLYGNLGLGEAFGQADNILTTAAKGIAEIITLPGQINVDFEDVNTVMKSSGVALMGSAVSEGEDRAKRAVETVLNSPLLEDNDIRGATQILLNINSSQGAKEMTMDEMTIITDYIMEEAGHNIDVIWGHGYDDSLGDKISITLIATGFSNKYDIQPVAEKEVIRISIDADEENEKIISPDALKTDNATVVELDTDDVKDTINTFKTETYITSNDSSDPILSMETEASISASAQDPKLKSMKDNYVRKSQAKPLDSPEIIQELEKMPAYERRNVSLDDITSASSEGSLSNTRINVDDLDNFGEEQNFRKGNSFLHDNVD